MLRATPCIVRRSPRLVTRDDVRQSKYIFLDYNMCERGLSVDENAADPLASLSTALAPCPQPLESGGCGCETGWDLASRLEAMGATPATTVVVHTLDQAAALRMVLVLKSQGIHRVTASPFGSDRFWAVLRGVGLAD